MTKPLIQIDDEIREMTNAEYAEYKANLEAETKIANDIEATASAKSALLERLGITAEEAALLLG
jgi:hypothetical protein